MLTFRYKSIAVPYDGSRTHLETQLLALFERENCSINVVEDGRGTADAYLVYRGETVARITVALEQTGTLEQLKTELARRFVLERVYPD